MKKSPDFKIAIDHVLNSMKNSSQLVHTERWQGMNILQKPEMAMYEILNYSLQVPIGSNPLDVLASEIKPNLPWADNHFQERVCGYPLNPGTEWENWPYGKSADQFRDLNGMFNHTYAERYWPRWAGKVPPREVPPTRPFSFDSSSHRGIRNPYGDLNDVVGQLAEEPMTRQAYLPMFFPEDTGGVEGGRVPCSLGYHFIMRGGFLHISYWLRSCDLVRHFRDDIYLTVRLLLWVLDELRDQDPMWHDVSPGLFTMHITSLHMFKGDYVPFFGEPKQ